MVQLPHPYMTTGKTIALTTQTFVGKVMSLLFNMLSRLVIAFLSRSKHLFISWLQSPSTVILEPKKINSVTVSIFSPSICHEGMGLDATLVFFFSEMCTSLLQLWETCLPKSLIYLLTWSIAFNVTDSVSTAPHHKCPPQTLTTCFGRHTTHLEALFNPRWL